MTKHITILATGSRGDVQPFVALGVGLRRSGFKVCIATHNVFKPIVTQQGLDFALIRGDPQGFVQSDTAQAIMQARNPLVLTRHLREALDPILEESQLDSWHACQGTNAIVAGGIAFWGIDIAEKLQVPCCHAFLQPAVPTCAFPSSSLPPASARWGRLYNRLTYTGVYWLIGQLFGKSISQFRQSVLKLPPTQQSFLAKVRQRRIPLLNAVSPSVIPKPTDWTDRDHMTGYWFLDQAADFTPSKALADFIAKGSPPVYLGFGSMGGQESQQTLDMALEALEKVGQRVVLLTGWSGVKPRGSLETVLEVSSIPHDWLFPQMSCIIHHGGAGTSAATFRSGTPGVILPFLIDQPFWSDRAFKLGVSPADLDRKSITVDKLTAAIEAAISNPGIQERAAVLGQKIRSEDGVEQAVAIIHQTIEAG